MKKTLTTAIKPFSILLALSIVAACGGGGSSPGVGGSAGNSGSGNGGNAGGGNATPNNTETGVVENRGGSASANVDGISYNYTGDHRYFKSGDGFAVNMENLYNHTESWTVSNIKPEIGIYSCDSSNAESPTIVLDRNESPFGSSEFSGDCSITVTSVDADGFTGIFSGTIAESDAANAASYSVSGGQFEVKYINVIPDADMDELSDADDNCPFHANPDQADEDGDHVGDACEQEEEEG